MARILIVEDSATQAVRLEIVLAKRNYTVDTAENGRRALDMIQENQPDLVISDITMPVMNGFEMCTSLKNNPDTRDIPVLLLTNLADPDDLIHGLNAQADSYVTKPYDEDYLLKRVAECLKRQRLPQNETRPLEIEFGGKRHIITAGRSQMFQLFLHTY